MKTSKTLVPSIINAVSSLLLCRNQHMNTCATINTLALRRGKEDRWAILDFKHWILSIIQFRPKKTAWTWKKLWRSCERVDKNFRGRCTINGICNSECVSNRRNWNRNWVVRWKITVWYAIVLIKCRWKFSPGWRFESEYRDHIFSFKRIRRRTGGFN